MTSGSGNLLQLFVRHPNASHLLMAVMILFGVYGITHLSRQVMPSLTVNVVSVSLEWPGAGPEDIERNVISTIEQAVRFLEDVDELESVASDGRGQVTITFDGSANMSRALADVQAAVARISTLPADASRPVISQLLKDERVSRLEISGPFPEAALQGIARRIRDDLLARGLSKVVTTGSRNPEIWVEVRDDALRDLGLTLQQVSARIAQASLNHPAGNLEVDGLSKLIRSQGAGTNAAALGDIEIVFGQSGEKVLLRDIASVRNTFAENSITHLRNGQPAIGLLIMRSAASDSITAQRIVDGYLEELRQASPPTLAIEQFDTYANVVRQQIGNLLLNGLQGFVIVVLALYAFIRGKVAFWVAAGIPVVIMATLGMLSIIGVTLNMITMFALIVGLGMVDDEAIVLGERAEALHESGMTPELATQTAASQMFLPVFAGSLTTMAAFVPMLTIGGTVGQVIAPIPLTIICLLTISLIECFLILPMHLRRALAQQTPLAQQPRRNRRFREALDNFRGGPFRRIVAFCYQRPFTTVTLSVCFFVLSMTLLMSGRVVYEFSPTVEGDMAVGNFAFSPGTSRQRALAMVQEMERAAKAAEDQLTEGKGGLIAYRVGVLGAGEGSQDFGGGSMAADHIGSYIVELVDRDRRDIHLRDFMRAWSDGIRRPAGIEQLGVSEVKVDAAPGKDVRLSIHGADLQTMKAAALDLRRQLESIPGVSAVADDAPYGKQEVLLTLTPSGKSMGLTNESVALQVRNALEGAIAKRFPGDDGQIPVRVRLSKSDQASSSMTSLHVRTPDGVPVPLADIVEMQTRVGPSSLRRINGLSQISVTADLDTQVTTTNQLVSRVRDKVLPALARDYGVSVEFLGRTKRQSSAVAEIAIAFMLALSAIYLILAAVLSSYARPLLVMSVVPFGLAGVVVGHYVAGFNLSYLGIIAFLGFTGVVVNGAIILVTAIDENVGNGMSLQEAVVTATHDRLRPIFFTQATTIGALLPILWQDNLAADFLKPLAVTIIVGLLFSVVTVLGFIPALLGMGEAIRRSSAGRKFLVWSLIK